MYPALDKQHLLVWSIQFIVGFGLFIGFVDHNNIEKSALSFIWTGLKGNVSIFFNLDF